MYSTSQCVIVFLNVGILPSRVSDITEELLLDLLHHLSLLLAEALHDDIEVDPEYLHPADPEEGGGDGVSEAGDVVVDTEPAQLHPPARAVGSSLGTQCLGLTGGRVPRWRPRVGQQPHGGGRGVYDTDIL